MQHYHVRTGDHNYGASDTLLGAMRNAQVHVGMFAACCMSLEFDDMDDLKYNVDEPDSWAHGKGDTVECIITITKPARWTYAGTNQASGTPTYDFVGDEKDMPNELDEVIYHSVIVHLDTGVIETQEV